MLEQLMLVDSPFLVVHQVIWYSLESGIQHCVSDLGLSEGDAVLFVKL